MDNKAVVLTEIYVTVNWEQDGLQHHIWEGISVEGCQLEC